MQASNEIAIQIKPAGNSCNICCDYCYAKPFRVPNQRLMPDDILEALIKKCSTESRDVILSWHGGEPLLARKTFFDKSMFLINKHLTSQGKQVYNFIQTNAMLVNREFANFFHNNNFVVSVSLDGPEYVHNIHRKDKTGAGTFHQVMRGIDILRQGGADPSVIITVTQETLPFAREVFHFAVGMGFKLIKYSPVYDSECDAFSIDNDAWFGYLREVFHEWFTLGNPEIQVRELDEVIAWMSAETISVCSSNGSCGKWISIDPDGNLYPCEYLRSTFSYGNIMKIGLHKVYQSKSYQDFIQALSTPNEKCAVCKFFKLCGNGCPATRVKNGKITPGGIYVYCKERMLLYQEISSTFNKTLSS